MDVKEAIKSKCVGVEDEMKKYALAGDSKIQEMILHPINAGGKRIRPCLTLLACEAVGGEAKKALPAAASIELLHTFTLVHDDIMDNDLERRGQPTVHSLWGEDMAILVGDALYCAAFKAMAALRTAGVPPDHTLDALDTLIAANEEVTVGQMMDMLFERNESVSEQEYTSMIRKKTGALIEAAVKVGAIVGAAPKEQVNAFSVYGSNCGLAFQIKDDILDLTADRKTFGKPVGSDIRAGKKTLLIIHAMNHGSVEDRKRLSDVLGRIDASEEEVTAAIGLLERIGSIKYCERRVVELIDEAKKSLAVVDDSEAKNTLLAIADYFVDRRL
ncbi:MAG: polyprenyl synthetase family protein [Candidatus Altiarchaeota archaeon]|nr:polyprenyl synthetase family protein [Candidatus Altiarchaeota archaeon]